MDGQLVDRVEHVVRQLQKLSNLFIRAGDNGVDLLRKRLKARVQRHFDPGKGRVVRLRHFEPIDVHAHVLQKLADFQALALGTDAHHLVQCRFDLHAAAHKACRNAAGQVVAFQHQHVLALLGKHQRGRKSRQSAADDNDVIMILVEFHRISFL